MALFRISMRSISRGRGELVLLLAAYTAGERLYLERENTFYNFGWRRDVVHTELIGNHGWTREALWNSAEWSEARWDGVTGREFLVALPHELSRRDQIQLARKLGRYLNRKYGVAVDVAVHLPSDKGDRRNVHAHLIVTTRVMTPWGLGARTSLWDRKYTGGQELKTVRQVWARMLNRALRQAGREERVDERSYEDQGLARLPGLHLGPVMTELERNGTPTRVGDHNRTVDLLNRTRMAIGRELAWDWDRMPDKFDDNHGAEAYRACCRRMFEIRQSIVALEGDQRALSRRSRKEMDVEMAKLRDLRMTLRPFMTAVMETRIQQRRLKRELGRKRGRAA